jgi:hypothetical protein
MRAIVWAEAELLGEWTTITDAKANVSQVTVGHRVNVSITIVCSNDEPIRYRTRSHARVIGPHTLVTNTPNPTYSLPITISC